MGRKGKNAEKHMIIAHYIHVWKFSNEIFYFCYYVHEIHIDKIKSFKICSIRVWEIKHTPTPQIVGGPQKKKKALMRKNVSEEYVIALSWKGSLPWNIIAL